MTSIFKYFLSTLLLSSLLFSGCVKNEFDAPPIDGEEVDIVANTSIADLKAMLGPGFTKITEDVIISGVVVADDRSGNFFRNFILQDETAGISISINMTDAYNLYPIGRELFIKCQSLYLGDDNGTIILGEYLYIEDGAENLGNIINLNEFIIKGKRREAPAPKVTSINQLTANDISTLIQLDMVEFTAIDKNQTYADPVGRRSLNRTLIDCNGLEIVVRSSGYADFAGALTPSEGGTAIGIYSVFGTTKQLLIRDESDIQMTIADVCSGGGGGTGGSGDLMAIDDLRALFFGEAVPAPAGRSIKGIVTSDKDNGNINGQNLTIQDDGAGIVVRFTSVHSFAMGEELEINVSSGELSEFNGLLQVANVNTGSVSRLSAGNDVTPMTLSISEIQDQFEDIESMLVKIEDAMISGSSTFSGGTTLDDGTGTITLFTAFGASFADVAVPSEATDVTAVVSQFNDRQLFARNLDDIPAADGTTTGGTDDECNPDALLCEEFNSGMFGEALDLPGWTNYNVTGNLKWNGGDFDDNFYADINPFNMGENAIESWLITPGIEVTSDHILSYETAQHHWQHAGLSVWISTDYEEGDDPTDAEWEEVEAPSPQESDEWYAWIPSGDVSLSDYAGETVYVGFKFVGDSNSNTTGFRVDNVVIE